MTLDLLTYLQAALLGVVEGLTEFIPVSSTGHLILLIDLLGFEGPPGKVFEIVIQLGAILAVCWLYRHKLWSTAMRAPSDWQAQKFILLILLAFLPAAVIGAFAHGYIKSVLFNPTVVSVALIVGGIIILLVERMEIEDRVEEVEQLSFKTALAIGFMQCLAMIPGTSRSGATIIGARVLGVSRIAATEFSFFLAIPTMFGAVVYDLYKNWEGIDFDNAGLIALGFVCAFIAGLLVVGTVIRFISRHGFAPFGWYRIALGTIMLVLLLA